MANHNDIIEGKIPSTGFVKINTSTTIKQWSHLWGIFQWNDEYRIIKYIRKDSPKCVLKITINAIQAKTLIEELDLQPSNDTIFSGATTWRRQQDWQFLMDYREEQRIKRVLKAKMMELGTQNRL